MALSNLTKVQTLGIGSNIEVVGVITTGQFKSGTSNLHSTGVELTNLNVSGIATIGGNLSIGGTLTYEDVTNIDSIGIITARAGVNVSGGQLDVGSNIKLGNAGVITATSANITSHLTVSGELRPNGNIYISNTQPKIFLTDTDNNSDYRIENAGGIFNIYDETETASRFRITSGGKIGVNQTSPYSELDITSSVEGGSDTLSAHGIRLAAVGATDEQVIPITAGFRAQQDRVRAGIGFISKQASGTDGLAGAIGFYTRSSADGNVLSRSDEKVRITQAGILLVGHTSSPTSDADKLQVISTSSGTGINIFNYSASNYGNQIAFMKSRSNTIGTNTILQSGDRIGELNFYGNDGSGRSLGAQIQVRINGTPSNDNTPAAIYLNTGLNQSMQNRVAVLPAGTVGISKNGWATSDHSFGLTVHTGSTSETGPVPDGIMIVSQQNNGNQNSSTGKLMFCGHAQTNGPFLYGDGEQAYGKKGLVFHTLSTANSYSTQLEETARFTHSGYFGLGTGTAVDSLMHIQGNSDSGDEHCQLTIEDEDTTSGSQIPSIMFKGNGSQLCKIRATSDKPIRIFDGNNAERWLINEYGETISEESNHGWSTYEHHAKSGGTRFHYRQVGTGASGTTINLIRVRRHYWGSGNYKITMKQTYYNGSYESIFWLNGHAANGSTTSFSIAHSNENSGNSSWIQKTATSHSAPGNNYAGWTDVYANLGAYTYYEITIEASMMPTYSHDINSIGNDGYALHAF